MLVVIDLGNKFPICIFPSKLGKLSRLASQMSPKAIFLASFPYILVIWSFLLSCILKINLFSSFFPAKFGHLGNLKFLYLTTCSLTGYIPYEIFKMYSLSKVDPSNNPLWSLIPQTMGNVTILTILNMVNTQLNGPIPS